MAHDESRNRGFTKKQCCLCFEISCFCLLVGAVAGLLLVLATMTTGNDEDMKNEELFESSTFEKPLCSQEYPKLSINITNSKKDDFGNYVNDNGLVFTPESFWHSKGSVFGCPCSVKPCIPKCCPKGEEFEDSKTHNTTICVKTNKTLFYPLNRKVFKSPDNIEYVQDFQETPINDNHFYILLKEVCPHGTFTLNASKKKLDKNILFDDGLILRTGLLPHILIYDQDQYCLESFKGSNEIYTNICKVEDKTTTSWDFNICGFLLLGSTIFIGFALLIYTFIPKLRNLQGKCLICYMAGLFVDYGVLSFAIFGDIGKIKIESEIILQLIGFVFQFFFLSTFFWLNVMCIDIWWTFRNPMMSRGATKEEENRTFLHYSLYAFGSPLLVSTLAAFSDLLPLWVKLVFLWFMPYIILNGINLLMFIVTLCRLVEQLSDDFQFRSERSQRHYNAQKGRFYICLKLAVVMGVNWIVNLLLLFIPVSKFIVAIFNVNNALQGFFIFLIFICKKQTFQLVSQKFSSWFTSTNSSCYKSCFHSPTSSVQECVNNQYSSEKSTSV